MNLKGRIGIAAHPDLRLKAQVDRLEFALQSDATLAFGTQTIRIGVGEIPLRLAIPFHRHRAVVAGSLGPFNLTVRPVEASLRIADAHCTGTLGGAEGLTGELHCQGKCKAEIDFNAEAPGKVLKAAVEFEE